MSSKIILSLSIFFFSLSTFSYRAAALAFIFIALTFFLNQEKRLLSSKKFSAACIAATAFVLIASVSHSVHMLYVVKFTAMIFYCWILYSLVKTGVLKASDLCASAKVFIYIHSLFFSFQLVYYMAVGDFIDFNNIVREEESRVLWASQALHGFIIPIRATGLFSEPSFYSLTVLPIALILAVHEKTISPAVVLGFTTCILSLSIAALIISAISGILVILRSKNSKLLKLSIVGVVIAISPSLYGIYEARILRSADYDAVASRVLVFEEFRQRGIVKNIFGSGFLWNEDNPIGVTGLKGFHTRDSSFFVNIFFSAGVFGLVIVAFSLFFAFRKNLIYLAAVLLAFLFKLSILHAMLWLVLLMAYTLSKEGRSISASGR